MGLLTAESELLWPPPAPVLIFYPSLGIEDLFELEIHLLVLYLVYFLEILVDHFHCVY